MSGRRSESPTYAPRVPSRCESFAARAYSPSARSAASRASTRRRGFTLRPLRSTPQVDGITATVVGAHEFRNRFGWYMERASAGEDILVTRRGKSHLRLTTAVAQTRLAA